MKTEYQQFLEEMDTLHSSLIGFNGLLQAVVASAISTRDPGTLPDAVNGLGDYFRAILDQMDAALTHTEEGVSV